MNDENGDSDILETETETTPDVEVSLEDETTQEEVDKLKEKLAKAEEYGKNQKIRAERAEKEERKDKAEQTKEPQVQHDLSSKDTIALINAKVHEDDLDEVIEYAKFKKLSIAEALKTNVIKSSLAEKAEQRTTAEATTTGKTRGGSVKATGESLLQKAQKTGDLPERQEDLEALLEQRLKAK